MFITVWVKQIQTEVNIFTKLSYTVIHSDKNYETYNRSARALFSSKRFSRVIWNKFLTNSNDLILKIWAILGYLLLYLPKSGYIWLSLSIFRCLLRLSQAVLGCHGLSLDCPGIIYGLSQDFPCIISRLSMDHLWIIPALSLDYSWSIPDYP